MFSANRNILILDNRDSFTYNLVQVFEELDCNVTVLNESEFKTENVIKYKRIVFSPGPGLPNDFPLMFNILRNAQVDTKILGICLGHQAIGEFFGAKLFRQKKVQHGQRKFIHNICKSVHSAISEMPGIFEAGLYHSWAVDINSIPDVLAITCMSDDGIVMGIIHKTLPIEGIQFHPESFLTKDGSKLLNDWLNL